MVTTLTNEQRVEFVWSTALTTKCNTAGSLNRKQYRLAIHASVDVIRRDGIDRPFSRIPIVHSIGMSRRSIPAPLQEPYTMDDERIRRLSQALLGNCVY